MTARSEIAARLDKAEFVRLGIKKMKSPMKLIFVITVTVVLLTAGCGKKETSSLMSPQTAQADSSKTQTNGPKKKVLFVDSYHRGYEWSDAVTNGILLTFKTKLNEDDTTDNSKSQVDLKIFRMDTKHNISEGFKKAAALEAKDLIESWKPDVVITSDDNAFKYLIMPYYKDADMPIVFCGLNWDASVYGAPYSNTTGMVEVALIKELMKEVRLYSHGNRIGFLAGNEVTSKKEAAYYKTLFNLHFTEKYVDDFEDWKKTYIDMQQNFDILILCNNAGINDWNEAEAIKLISTHTVIPACSTLDWMIKYSLLVYARIPEEQGEWAAKAALEILNGKSPSDIPVVMNEKAKVHLNMEIAKKLRIVFPMDLINKAKLFSTKVKHEN
jgi:ABC-type uncharacterized transport system substrate-binding protein